MRAMRIVVLLVTAAATIAACSDDGDDPTKEVPIPDGGSPLPTAESGAGDAPSEAAPQDAGTPSDRICSDDSWCHTEPPAGHFLLDAWGDGAGSLWAASILDPGGNDEHGGIARFDAATKIWKQHHEVPKARVAAIWGASATDLWAGGPGGLLHGDGATWTAVPLENGLEIEDIAGSAAGGVWVAGTNPNATTPSQARLFHRAAGASAWAPVTIEGADAGPDATYYSEIRKIWIVANGDIWIAARAGRDTLLRRRAGGTTWSVIPTPTEAFQFTGVGPVADDPWILGYVLFKGGAKYWDAKASVVAGAGDWTAGRWKGTDPSSDQIRRYAVWGTGATDLWTGGAFSLLEHWNGATWTIAKTSVDGIPLADDVVTFWGTSNDDLWAVGGRTALHKVSQAEAATLEAAHAKDGGP